MKDVLETAAGIIGNLRVMLFVTVASAALLYFPASLIPPGAAGAIEQYRGWIWFAFVVGLTGLLVRLCLWALALSGTGLKSIIAARKRERQIADMGEVLHGLDREEAALAFMFLTVSFDPITVIGDHPAVRSLRYKGVISYPRSGYVVLRRDSYAMQEMTAVAQAYLERHPDTFRHLDINEALRIANPIMERAFRPYRAAVPRY